MGTRRSSETSVHIWTTRRWFSEYGSIHNYCCEGNSRLATQEIAPPLSNDQDYMFRAPCPISCTLHLLSINLRRGGGGCGSLPRKPPTTSNPTQGFGCLIQLLIHSSICSFIGQSVNWIRVILSVTFSVNSSVGCDCLIGWYFHRFT
jgi:hypothetical protein